MREPMPESPPIPWRISIRAIWHLGRLGGVIIVGVTDFMLRPSNRRTLADRARWLQRNCQRCLWALNITLDVRGQPPAGVLLTPNHVSYLDIIVLSALTPTVFVAKAEVARWPIFGWFAQRAGTRFLRRDLKADLVRVGAELKPVIEAGMNLVIFLEGTSTDGNGVRPFKSSLLEPAVREVWPTVPVALRYRLQGTSDPAVIVAWWGTMPLGPHLLTLTGQSRIRGEVDFGKLVSAEGPRKALAQHLQGAVANQLRELHGRATSPYPDTSW
jgi:lyso-ornithine lipid O-acyltransferase